MNGRDVTIILVALLAVIAFHTEGQRDRDETRQRIFMQQKLDAILADNSAISAVTGVYFKYSKNPALSCCPDKEYQEALDRAREVINRHEVLFSWEVNEDIARVFEVHRALMQLGFQDAAGYRAFVAALSTETDELFQAVLANLEKPGSKPVPRLKLAPIPFDVRDKLTPKEYLERHLQYRKTDIAG